MPELPEVQTTVKGLHETVIGKKITFLWSDLPTKNHVRKNEIKNLAFWNDFQKKVLGATILSVERRGKNILINLNVGYTILVHMKMTGHILVGNYRPGTEKDGDTNHTWKWWGDTEHLQDPFNRFIHFVATFSDGTSLALCDSRKFASVTILPTSERAESSHLKHLGPDAVNDSITESEFKTRLMKRSIREIKTVLLDQTLIAGIGNIYSDEMLWLAGIHPKRLVHSLNDSEWKKLWQSMRPVLEQGIDFGGDSTSDYRNVFGARGEFHHQHNAYRLTGKPCKKKNCRGTIQRVVIGGRSAHFCDIHQK